MADTDLTPASGTTAAPDAASAPEAHDGHRSALAVVQALPELLVLLAAAGALSTGLFIAAGRLSVPGVVVVAVLLFLLLARGMRSYALPTTRWDVAASVVVVLGAVAWAVFNLPYVSQHLFVNRDPSVFTLTALFLVDQGSPVLDPAPGLWAGPGFERGADGLVRSQNSHVVPGIAALVGRVVGSQALLSANLLVGAAVLVAAYTAARRWMPIPWALVVPLTLGLGLPFLTVSRGIYTEPTATLFMLAGVTALSAAARRPGVVSCAVTGLLVGGAGMVRIDGVLVVVAFVPCLALLLLRGGDVQRLDLAARGRRAAGCLAVFVLASALPIAVGATDLLRWSTPSYLDRFLGTLATALVLLGGTAVVTCGLLLVVGRLGAAWRARWGAVPERAGGRWRWLVVAVGAAVLLFTATAPLWLQGTHFDQPGSPYAASVANLQETLGLPVDGTRSYDEYALTSVTWYHGWVAAVLGFVGLTGMAVAGLARRAELLVVPAVLLPLLTLLTVDLGITPDQVWASRRMVMVVIPLLLLAAAWALAQIGRGPILRRVLAGVLAVALVAAPFSTLQGVVLAPQEAGATEVAGRMCAQVGDDVVVVVGTTQSIAPSVAVLCDSTVVLRDGVTAADTPELVETYGEDVVIVTTDRASVGWATEPEAPTVDARVPVWQRELLQEPQGLTTRRLAVWVGSIDDTGAVVPIAP